MGFAKVAVARLASKGAVQITSRTLRSACPGAVFAEEQGEESHGGPELGFLECNRDMPSLLSLDGLMA